MKKEIEALDKAYDKYQSTIGKVESRLSEKIEFDFSISYYPGDGHCILNPDNSQVAALDDCLDAIKSYGTLTADVHEDIAL